MLQVQSIRAKVCRVGAWSALFLAVSCTGDGRDKRGTQTVDVFAASSLTDLMNEIAGQWSAQSGRAVRLQFGASSTLARQIAEGADADVFVAADPKWLDGLPAEARFDWLSNRLVLVVARDAPDVSLSAIESLALADEQVPAGRYARAAMGNLGLTLPARIIYGSSVRDVLAKVSQGGASAGIVYATDAAIDRGVRVSYTFPPESHPRILYAVAVLAPQGRDFFDLLHSDGVRAIAARHGFIVLP